MPAIEDTLERLWGAEGDDLPFNPRTDVYAVVNFILSHRSNIDALLEARIRQWLKFVSWTGEEEQVTYAQRHLPDFAEISTVCPPMEAARKT